MDTATLGHASDTIASLKDIQTTPLSSLTTDQVGEIVDRIVSEESDPLAVEVALFQSAI